MVETRPERKVIVIPAREKTPEEQERKKNLRVAAYCRVSTNSEEQLSSYENQLAYYTEKIMKNPEWTMMEVFADEGITGTSTSKRKNFLRMIRQCRQGKIDLILTKSISRFARNTVDTLNYTRELRNLGIPVIFEEHGLNSIYPESEFLITIFGAQAQAESESTSSRVRWGVQQSMRTSLVSEGRRNALGTTEWTTSNLQTILTDEKYCGDVLRQKTFIQDCISKKAIRNTGQLPKYLIQNHHDAIIDRAQFDAVQMELARRRAQRGSTRKSAPSGLGRYSGKYALSGLLFCGECGTAYRRVVWTQHGEKRTVWRCCSRLDYGKKYCEHSPTLDEAPLQQAILNAVNASMSDHGTLSARLMSAMEQELAPIPGESMSLGDIDRAMEELGKQFDKLLGEAANADDAETYVERFQSLSEGMEELKRRKASILQIRQEQDAVSRRLQASAAALDAVSAQITEWDEKTVYQLLEKVTVMEGFKIRVTFRNGHEIEQSIDQPKRRKRI